MIQKFQKSVMMHILRASWGDLEIFG